MKDSLFNKFFETDLERKFNPKIKNLNAKQAEMKEKQLRQC